MYSEHCQEMGKLKNSTIVRKVKLRQFALFNFYQSDVEILEKIWDYAVVSHNYKIMKMAKNLFSFFKVYKKHLRISAVIARTVYQA